MNTTTHYGLLKPIALERYSVDDMNDNSDLIDSALKGLDDKIDALVETDPTVPDWAKKATKPTYTKSEVGLSSVDNTSDKNKPVSTAQQTAINTALSEAKSYTDTEVANLVNGAPETLDTLKEIADALEENETVVSLLNSAIGTKADKTDFDAHVADIDIHITSSEHEAWTDANNKKHTHDNKDVLDGITVEQIASWDEAADIIAITNEQIDSLF